MSNPNQSRAKILGQLIHDARMRVGLSIEDCANSLGMDKEQFAGVEGGDEALSLPDLEVLALVFRVPMAYFWGHSEPVDKTEVNYADYVALRHRIIGALIRHARLEAGQTTEELAEKLGLEPDLLKAHESGSAAIPYFLLERVAEALNVPLDYFGERDHGPLARHEKEHQMLKSFEELPPEVRSFVAKPLNRSYLETAMRLSEMDVNRLRGIAESILDITF